MVTITALAALLTLASPWDAPATTSAEWVAETLGQLTLREKVAQMVMVWIPGGAPAGAQQRNARAAVAQHKVGGLIVGAGGAVQTATRLNELQRAARVPLLVAADLEWGAGTRLRGTTVLPVNMALAATGDTRFAYEAGRITALEARAAGIHMAFAPVADVNINPLNPVINTRSYGADADAVAERVAAFVEGARSGGLLSVAKHFPGHGDTEDDSHLELPFLLADRGRIDAVELVPFRAAAAAGVTGIMTAHLAVPALEPNGDRSRPATLSGPILTDLLRNELGFRGLIVTDALTMDGVRKGRTPAQVAVEAVRAGADILLMPASAATAIDAVVAAVQAGEISEGRIEESVRRILEAKAAAGLHRERLVEPAELSRLIARREHREWVEAAAERSLTLVRGTVSSLPVPMAGRRVLNVVYDDGRGRVLGRDFEAVLTERGGKVTRVRLSRRSTAAALREAERAARQADLVIFSSYARALPWKGTLGLPEGIASFADRLAAGGAVVISFGDPYLVRQLPSAGVYLLAWSETGDRAAGRALLGQVPITGRLPIPLPPRHGLGDGLEWPAPALVSESTVRPVPLSR